MPIIYLEKEKHNMSDLQVYISDRKKDPEFTEGYDEGFPSFKIGVLLKQAREEAALLSSHQTVINEKNNYGSEKISR